MRRRTYRQQGPGGLDLIEEATHLLRRAPAATLALYYVGALPFVLGLLYFVSDMARSATAHRYCAPAAFGLACLYLWMKTWQALFATQLKERFAGRPSELLTIRRALRVAVIQTALQPWKFVLLPLAALATVPFGWVFAFFENVTAFGADPDPDADRHRVFRQSLRQTWVWPSQNHLLLALLGLFGFVVFLDVLVGLASIPALIKTFLGVETAFTRGGLAFLNTTFLAVCAGVAFLCLDPLLKAVFVLRTFYGESLQTGEDLRLELQTPSPEEGRTPPGPPRSTAGGSTAGRTAAVLLALIVLAPTAAASVERSSTPNPAPPAGQVAPDKLDRAIGDVLSRREFTWRLPRERLVEDEAQKGVFASFKDGLLETVQSWWRTIKKWIRSGADAIRDLMDWIQRKLGRKSAPDAEGSGGGFGWIASLHFLVWVLVTLLACVAVIFLWRVWKQRRPRAEVVAEALPAVPDLTDENVLASDLPEDEWLKLARELIGRGDLRLALRALYLASLSHLAQRELIHIAKFKSNRDYERELRRRARALPEIQTAFAENVGTFDRVWYGLHEVTGDALRLFQANVERIKSC